MEKRSLEPLETDEWPDPPRKHTGRKPFSLEYRMRPEEELKRTWTTRWTDWSPHYVRYRTERAREQALEILNQKDSLFEYRIPK